jgi:hypothetical protein
VSEHPHLKRIDDWIALLEQKARTLLDGLELDAEEMTPKQRIESATKLVTLAQRYMLIRQQREAAQPPARDNQVIYALMRQMRGETTVIAERAEHTEEG